jgi:membrane protease YdiL (CAAX protease family)
VAGLIVGLVFGAAHLTPTNRNVTVLDAAITWNYDTFLNIGFMLVIAVLLVRFLRTGGPMMLRMMSAPPGSGSEQRAHAHHDG